MSTELSPCPFCGGRAHKLYDDDQRWTQIGCNTCGAKSAEFLNADEDLLVRAWNRRPHTYCGIARAERGYLDAQTTLFHAHESISEETMREVLGMPGVTNVIGDRYLIQARISPAYTWAEVEPAIVDLLRCFDLRLIESPHPPPQTASDLRDAETNRQISPEGKYGLQC